MSTPARSTTPRTPSASAIRASVKKNSLGPRLRGFRGRRGSRLQVSVYAGTVYRGIGATSGTAYVGSVYVGSVYAGSVVGGLGVAVPALRPGGVPLLAVQEPHDDSGDDRDRPREPEGAGPVARPRRAARAPRACDGDRAAASVEAERLVGGALLGHEEPRADVEEEAGAAEEDSDDQRHAHDDRVDVEVAGDAAGDAGDVPVGDAATQAAEVRHLVAADAGAAGRRVGEGGCSPPEGGVGCSVEGLELSMAQL